MYLDDIIIFWIYVEEHLDLAWIVQILLLRASVLRKLKKSFVLQDDIDYFGHVI